MMRTGKTLLIAVLAAVTAMSLCACGKNDSKESSSANNYVSVRNSIPSPLEIADELENSTDSLLSDDRSFTYDDSEAVIEALKKNWSDHYPNADIKSFYLALNETTNVLYFFDANSDCTLASWVSQPFNTDGWYMDDEGILWDPSGECYMSADNASEPLMDGATYFAYSDEYLKEKEEEEQAYEDYLEQLEQQYAETEIVTNTTEIETTTVSEFSGGVTPVAVLPEIGTGEIENDVQTSDFSGSGSPAAAILSGDAVSDDVLGEAGD